MIQKRTTLILGAGASKPFGFPTGYELLQEVLAKLNFDTNANNQFKDYFQWLGFDQFQVSIFREALLRSGRMSVDAFLEHRPEFISIGKAAIAATLISCENENKLFERKGDSWYEYLFHQLNTGFGDFGENKLNVLTFNYDRSLEYFLFTALKAAYGKHGNECANLLKKIPIIHLHGDLGELPCFNDTARFYETKITTASLKLASERIKIIHEDTNAPQFGKAKELLASSELICFLGFGYYIVNLRRLGFLDGLPYKNASIYGSTHGLTPAEQNHISTMLSGRLILTNRNATSCDVLGYLRQTGFLLSAAV